MERVALPHGDEPVEGAQRRRVREQLHARGARLLRQLARMLLPALGEQTAARLGALVRQHDVGAQLAAAIAADSPAAPPPTTRTSACRRRYSVRHSRSGCDLRSLPSPAAARSTFSYSGQKRRGRMKVL